MRISSIIVFNNLIFSLVFSFSIWFINAKLLSTFSFFKKHGKALKPVNRRSKFLPPPGTLCPICSAPYEYIYDNSGGRGQLGCKVCKSTFYPNKAYLEKLTLKCPHCSKSLQKKRDSRQFFVYTCVNKHCPFYIHNLTSMSKDEKADFEKNPYKYKLHYYYRVFDIEIDSLKEDTHKPSTVDLSRIKNSKYVLGLDLAYHINYGLSTRQTHLYSGISIILKSLIKLLLITPLLLPV